MLFDIKFNPPQNFAAYRQAEMDTARVSTFQTMVGIPFISKRFALKRFLGLSEEEIAENQTKWQEENIENMNNPMNAAAEMRAGGITAGGAAADLGAIDAAGIPPEGMDADMGAGEPGMGTAPPASGGAPNAGPGGGQM